MSTRGASASAPTAVALALPGDPRETAVLDVLESARGCTVVRRCLDIPDLLALAHAGRLDVAVIGGHVLRWDRDVVARLQAAGVGVLGIDARDARGGGLASLGADAVLLIENASDVAPRSAELAARIESVRRAAGADDAARSAIARGFSHGRPTSPPTSPPAPAPAPTPIRPAARPDGGDHVEPDGPAAGAMVSVWGPTGAPGRSTVAIGIAAEWARAGAEVLLIDADPYGGSIDQMLGMLDDEVPGTAAACRLAQHGLLDAVALVGLARQVSPNLSVLTGLPRADRWPELRPASLAALWDVARSIADVVVVDTGFCLEEDEELSYDTLAPRRNAATISAIGAADLVVAVGSIDPVGLRRLVRGLDDLDQRQLVARRMVVGTRGTGKGRQSAVRREVEHLLRVAGHDELVHVLPDDPITCRRAARDGLTLSEAAPGSALVKALRALTVSIEDSRIGPWGGPTDAAPEGRAALPLGRLRRLVG